MITVCCYFILLGRTSNSRNRMEDRPNNWDFSDWRPSTTFDITRRNRDKRTNSEKEVENQVERGTSLSQDSTPRMDRKGRTPSTFPRTKITPVTPVSQMAALDNLKKYMSFSDTEEKGTGQEKNNERLVRREHNTTGSLPSELINDVSSIDMAVVNSLHYSNSNIDRESDEDRPDCNQVVGRLMQIRDYIKQASSMMEKLQTSADPGDQNRASQLEQVIARLKEQEHKYLDLLLNFTNNRENNSQEANMAEFKDDQSTSDLANGELDVESDSSEATMDMLNGTSRPQIEEHLGRRSDTENGGLLNSTQSSQSQTEESELEQTLVAQQLRLTPKDTHLVERQLQMQSDLVEKNEELEALRQQHDLLQKMLQQQEQLKALQDRQSTLLAMQQEAESRLAQEKGQPNQNKQEGNNLNDEAAVSARESVSDGDWQEDSNSQDLQSELDELTQRLQMLKDLYHKKQRATVGSENKSSSNVNTECDASLISLENQQLQVKLQDLQNQKRHMDSLLQKLQKLRGYQQGEMAASSAQAVKESVAAGDNAHVMLDSSKKLKKFHEVKERLDQLKNLVQYYQSGNEFIHESDTQDPPTMVSVNDFENPKYLSSSVRERDRGSVQQRLEEYARGGNSSVVPHQYGRTFPTEVQQQEEESQSDAGSQLSSLGIWGEDPEIQEKVRKLKAAKEKLKKLQELVSMVQQGPDGTARLPLELAELAASLSSQLVQSDNQQNGYLASDGEEANGNQRETYYEQKVRHQQQELEHLMEERHKLVVIQDQLQRLQLPQNTRTIQVQTSHDSVVVTGSGIEKDDDDADDAPEPSVTFQEPIATVASNDEIYGRMRQQRMLREELREKKKELENMMRKDRPHKQYSRNRDKESDNISLSNKSDQFGASVVSGDVTMATWGGSTVDNLESIEEENACRGVQQVDQDDDDGYPSDGIVQVEEEEEANDESDDADTYTIENEYRKGRTGKVQRPVIEGMPRKVRRHKHTSHSSSHINSNSRGPNYTMWSPNGPVRTQRPKKPQWNRNRGRQQSRDRQEQSDDRDFETRDLREQVQSLHIQMENTMAMCQSLMQQRSPWSQQNMTPVLGLGQLESPGTTFTDPGQLQLFQGLKQCYQQLGKQQEVMSSMGQYLQQLGSQLGTPPPDSEKSPVGGAYNLNGMVTLGADSNPNITNPFSLSPRFPDSFASVCNPIVANNPGVSIANNLQEAGRSRSGDANSQQQRLQSSDRKILLNNQRVSVQSNVNNPYHLHSNFQQGSNYHVPETCSRDIATQIEEEIPIQDVMASDIDKTVPRLNLSELLRSKQRKYQFSNNATQENHKIVRGRAEAAASLASQKVEDNAYIPSLSAGISGSGYQEDTASISSEVSSTSADSNKEIKPSTSAGQVDESDGGNNLSEFEAMRETIYSEVATLISQNENRPHFLIELFRNLQLLCTDLLRQRTLYSIQDLVSKHLADQTTLQDTKLPSNFATTCNISLINSMAEQTALGQSGSLVTSEDDEFQTMRKQTLLQDKGSLAQESGAGDMFYLSNATAQDPGSDGSVPEIPNPRINTQQVDKQMKDIMKQITPVIKEHLDDVCSQQLVQYIRRLILALTKHKDDSHDIAKFFHKQLDSILQDSLSTFEGRKIRECAQDLIGDISEILFNELAFFHLMKDLNQAKHKGRKPAYKKWRRDYVSSETSHEYKQRQLDLINKHDENDSTEDVTAESRSECEPSQSELETQEERDTEPDAETPSAEEEDLAKARDDELAAQLETNDRDDDSDGTSKLKIELAVSETKPYTQIGSDEDDDMDDEAEGAPDMSDTAVSRSKTEFEPASQHSVPASEEQISSAGIIINGCGENSDQERTVIDKEKDENLVIAEDADKDIDTKQCENESEASKFNEFQANENVQSTEPSKVQINGLPSPKQEEDGVTLDDLPAKMTSLSKEELDRQRSEEVSATCDTDVVLSVVANVLDGQELAGDPSVLKEPPTEESARQV